MDNKKVSLKLNMIMNAILKMSGLIFPLITFPYISRVLLPEGTGKIGFATSVVAYFAMFAQLGIPTHGIRECAKVRDDKEKLSKTVHELISISLVMNVIVYIAFGIIINIVPKFQQERNLLIIISASMILNTLGVDWLYAALEKYTYITVRSLIFKIISIGLLFALVRTKEDYLIYGAITIFAGSASNILNLINLRKHIIIKPLGDYNYKRHIKYILMFFSMSIATTIYTNLDNVMLGFIRGDIDVGYYSAAVKVKSILLCIVTSASSVLLPRASYYVEKKMMDEFYKILTKTMHFICLMGFSFCVYFMIWSKESVMFLSGKEYVGAILPMQVIMPTIILIGITNVTGIQMMLPLGMEKQVLYSEIAGAVVDLLLNAILIPKFGSTGAAIGTLVAEIVVLIYQFVAIRDIPVKIFGETPWLKIICATLGGIIACFFVKLIDLNDFVSLVVSSCCFFVVYGIILIILKDKLVKEVFEQILKKINFKTD